MSFVLHLRRLRDTRQLVAFYHPRPNYPVHILIVPKANLRRFEDISSKDSALLAEVIHIAQELVEELHLEADGYRLIVNGGKYQTILQLHFHLISGDELTRS